MRDVLVSERQFGENDPRERCATGLNRAIDL